MPTAKKKETKKNEVTLEAIEVLLRKVLAETIPAPIDTAPTDYAFDADNPNEYGAVPVAYAEKMRAQLTAAGHNDIAAELGTNYIWFNRPGLSENAKQNVRNNRNKWILFLGQKSENNRLSEPFEYYHFHNGKETRAQDGTIVALNLDATIEDVVNDIGFWINKKLRLKKAKTSGFDFSPVDPSKT